MALLNTSSTPLLSAALRVAHVLVRTQRDHLKLQMEMFLQRVMKIVTDEHVRVARVTVGTLYLQSEPDHVLLALEAVERLWRLEGFVRELYVNYDCSIYNANVLEETVKVLSENAFPVTHLHHKHILCMNALTTVLHAIHNDIRRRLRGDDVPSVEAVDGQPTRQQLVEQKEQKALVMTATDLFNNIKPEKGIAHLQEKGLLPTPSDAHATVQWLRQNPRLDKKKIAEYICSRKHTTVLAAFVQSFAFHHARIDEALRMFLEAFRLPGEAAEISMVRVNQYVNQSIARR